jgi:hypothetical protein
MFFYLLDMYIFNSFTVYHKINENKKTSYADFRINIAHQLVESVKLPEYSVRGRPSSSIPPPLDYRRKHGPTFHGAFLPQVLLDPSGDDLLQQ